MSKTFDALALVLPFKRLIGGVKDNDFEVPPLDEGGYGSNVAVIAQLGRSCAWDRPPCRGNRSVGFAVVEFKTTETESRILVIGKERKFPLCKPVALKQYLVASGLWTKHSAFFGSSGRSGCANSFQCSAFFGSSGAERLYGLSLKGAPILILRI